MVLSAGPHLGVVHVFVVCPASVAVQCLETAFEVSTEDQSLAVAITLPEIFALATQKVEEPPVNHSSGSPEVQSDQLTRVCVCV